METLKIYENLSSTRTMCYQHSSSLLGLKILTATSPLTRTLKQKYLHSSVQGHSTLNRAIANHELLQFGKSNSCSQRQQLGAVRNNFPLDRPAGKPPVPRPLGRSRSDGLSYAMRSLGQKSQQSNGVFYVLFPNLGWILWEVLKLKF